MRRRDPDPRKEMPDPKLAEHEFKARFHAQFTDPAFDRLSSELDRLAEAAWDGYINGRKSPRTRKAGPGFADPDYELSTDWLAARAAVIAAQETYEKANSPARFLLSLWGRIGLLPALQYPTSAASVTLSSSPGGTARAIQPTAHYVDCLIRWCTCRRVRVASA